MLLCQLIFDESKKLSVLADFRTMLRQEDIRKGLGIYFPLKKIVALKISKERVSAILDEDFFKIFFLSWLPNGYRVCSQRNIWAISQVRDCNAKIMKIKVHIVDISVAFFPCNHSGGCLLTNLDKILQGKRFELNDELIVETVKYFEKLDKSAYKRIHRDSRED